MLSSYQAQIIEQQKLYGVKQEEQEDIETTLKKQHDEWVKQFSKYDKYWIAIIDSDNNNQWIVKLFKRYKITTVDFDKSKEMSLELGEQSEENVEPNDRGEEEEEDDDDYKQHEQQQYELIDKTIQYYKFLAGCYLKMTEQEFDRCDWGKLRLVIDSCQYRTVRTLADGSMGLFEFFHMEDIKGNPITTHLTHRDYEALRMFRLWTGKAEIKPWHTNGGLIYEEDINTFLKLEELKISGDNMKERKARARNDNTRGGGTLGGGTSTTMGPDGVIHKHTTRFRNHR